ncbi:DUF4064 domain-containing protein [Staphylococcus succinus]|uniref:DUF4064 domain-containing protein n=1 Tax=Staphylococcus succinus TaxID=61015 RepID=UPI000B1319EC|nr:DUF4064 domain-containing protein [Staphylococcus succinus]MBU0438662.1 DUF4064 domain-containing protein [Staphylococcus succinus]PTI47151.1 hypothetical protein BU060_08755 [Staphylococcus succinus]PTJ84283.1 hypothetical protein BU055_04840 [Staphylococcus succinus]
MIKRTIERVLSWIGIALQLIGVVAMALFLPLMGNSDFKDTVVQSMQEQDSSFTKQDSTEILDILSSLITFGLVFSIIVLIIAIIAATLIGKKAKLAGVLLIIAGVVSILGNWINAILWIVAGIMLLVRKPKNDNDDNKVHTQENDLEYLDKEEQSASQHQNDRDNNYKY